MKNGIEKLFDFAKVGNESYREGISVSEIAEMAFSGSYKSASEDRVKTGILFIDPQNDFTDRGTLPVAGTFEDIKRAGKMIAENIENIHSITVSMDWHNPNQIFFKSWWRKRDGSSVGNYEIITKEKIESGEVYPLFYPEESKKYVEMLEKTGKEKEGSIIGKKELMIWEYHCLAGTKGAMVERELQNLLNYHEIARKTKTNYILKGTEPLSEMYGVFKAEYDPENKINSGFLKMFETYDRVAIMGEAASHCVLESVAQYIEYFRDREDILKKLYLVTDCTSAIAGFEEKTRAAFEYFKERYKINLVKSTELF